MNFIGKNKRKFIIIANILIIAIIVTSVVFAGEITVRLKSSTTYYYPYAGYEHIIGPERTTYYAIHYNFLKKIKYGEIIREVDNFVLSKVYRDGTSEDFSPPKLTEEDIKKWAEKYPKYIPN